MDGAKRTLAERSLTCTSLTGAVCTARALSTNGVRVIEA